MILTQENKIQKARKPEKKILVLGSALHTPSITAYPWSDLPEQLNVADFDVVILNLVSFLQQHNQAGIKPERLPSWQQLARLLFSRGSEIICIGLPSIANANSLYESITWWLPVTPEFVMNSGEMIQDIKAEFSYYFDQVSRWFFYAAPKFRPHFLGLPHYLKLLHPKADHLQVGMGVIARNRAQQPIAFKLMFRATRASSDRLLPARGQTATASIPLINSGAVIWLPPPTEISADEAVNLILRERYGLAAEQAPPQWVSHYQLPEQQAIASMIRQHQEEIDRLAQQLVAMRQQLEAANGFIRLLYEQNQNGLALLVSDVFQMFGAQVLPVSPSEVPVLRVIDPTGREALVLVKARAGTTSLTDLRQLDQGVRDRLFQQGWQGKGILLMNANSSTPPGEREAFPANCVRAAQHFGYCLMTTTQLYRSLSRHQQRELSLTEFWNALFEANGVSSLPELERSH